MSKYSLPTYDPEIKEWIQPEIGKKTKSKAKKDKHPIDPSHFPFAFIFASIQDYHYLNELQVRKSKRKSILIPKEEHAKVLEYLIFLSQWHFAHTKAVSFYHSFNKIAKKTGVSRANVIRIIKRFEEKLKIIHTSIGGKHINYATIYQIHYRRLISLLPAIYINGLEGAENDSSPIRFQMRKKHFEYMSEQFNTIHNRKKLYKQNEDSD